jgi:hypothetical protein
MGLDTKTYWLTDRQSQYDFDFCKFSSGQLRVVASQSREPMSQGHEAVRKGVVRIQLWSVNGRWRRYVFCSAVIFGVIWRASSCVLIELSGKDSCVCVCVCVYV